MKTIPWLKTIKVIAWDLDGTLFPNSVQLSQEIVRQQLKAVAEHLDISVNQAKKVFDSKYNELQSTTKTMDALGMDGHKFYLDIWGKMDLDCFIKANPILASNLEHIKNQDSRRQFLLTNSNNQETIKLKLDLIGIDLSVFDQIFNSVDIGFNKPDIEIFQYLWQNLNIEREEIVYIGDRERTDIQPARKYGLHTIKINPQIESVIVNENGKIESQADLIVPSANIAANLFIDNV